MSENASGVGSFRELAASVGGERCPRQLDFGYWLWASSRRIKGDGMTRELVANDRKTRARVLGTDRT